MGHGGFTGEPKSGSFTSLRCVQDDNFIWKSRSFTSLRCVQDDNFIWKSRSFTSLRCVQDDNLIFQLDDNLIFSARGQFIFSTHGLAADAVGALANSGSLRSLLASFPCLLSGS